jgi:hypothetical protein
MRTLKKIFVSALFCVVFSSCAHSVHLIHTSDFEGAVPYEKGKPVVVKTSQSVIMGFVTNSDYVDEAYKELLDRCDGRVTGITTKYSTALGFLSWENIIRMEGLCVR